MAIRSLTPILNVSDVPASLAWFEALGFERSFTFREGEGMLPEHADAGSSGPADFAGLCAGEVQLFLCRDGQGGRGADGVWMSVWLDSPAEVDGLHARCLSLGMDCPWPPTDEPWGVREFHLRHPDGHVLRMSAALVPG
jgi:uncharacterized glyoxalase superfamily protein PhnB